MLVAMSPSRRVFVLLLGIFVVLGMSLSAVQAGEMSVKMTAMSGTGATGHCKSCGEEGGTAKKMTSCGLGCITPGLALTPQMAPATFLFTSAPPVRRDSLLVGRVTPPDTGPPRISDLG
jgi:hypothetical protein